MKASIVWIGVGRVAALCLAVLSAEVLADAERDLVVDDAVFSRPTRVDNPWFPLRPGTRMVYAGTDLNTNGQVQAHHVEIHVTDLTKVVDGVRTVVSWDLDYADDQLVEAELAYYAQDDSGNVWRMGEHPEEYENGRFVESACWLAGTRGSKAGIAMLAKPEVGRSYSQGRAPSVEFTDRGRVDGVEERVEAPVGTFHDVLVIAETSEEEGPDAEQLKLYARGLGEIRVGWRGIGETTQEVLELVRVEALTRRELEEVRANALELERNAYEVCPQVFAGTPPMQPGGAPMAYASVESHRAAIDRAASASADARKISDQRAKVIALEKVPGTVTDIAVERKLGVNAIVVEIIASANMVETDVIIHPQTGEVLGTEE